MCVLDSHLLGGGVSSLAGAFGYCTTTAWHGVLDTGTCGVRRFVWPTCTLAWISVWFRGQGPGGRGGADISSVGACRDGRQEKISGYIDTEVHFVHCIVYDTGRWNTYYTFFLRGWLVFLQL